MVTTPGPSRRRAIGFSPDGSRLYLSGEPLLEVPAMGTASVPQEVQSDTRTGRVGRGRLAPSGIYSITAGGGETSTLHHYGWETRELEELFEIKGYLSSIHPDETSILTVYAPQPGTDLKLLRMREQ